MSRRSTTSSGPDVRAALGFLTILPVGRLHAAPGRGALIAFPIVGLVIGGLWAGVAVGALAWWDPLVAAVIVVTVDAIVTGGLHLDAVADIGDVVGSRRRGPQALEVARDPHVGALGALALLVVLLLRVAFVSLILSGPTMSGQLASHPAWTLIAVPVVGRAAMVAALAGSPRSGGSSATALAAAATPPVLAWSLMTAVAVLLLVVGPWQVAAVIAAATAFTAGTTVWWRRRVGAASGDLVGAVGVVAEVAVLAVIA
jgi:adenosylcobinamide-GDP ribazoletransferase